MPFIEPNPTQIEWLEWIVPTGSAQKISKWPSAGSNRVKSWFRLEFMKPATYVRWSAVRYYIRYGQEQGGVPFDYYGWLNMEAVGEGHLFGSSGLNSDGWECTIDVQAMAVLPTFGLPGVLATVRWQGPNPQLWMERKFWYLEQEASAWNEQSTLTTEGATFSETTRGPLLDVEVFDWQHGSLPDCYQWEPVTPAESFCACNGTDAYIQLNGSTPFFGWYHKMECDVRFRSLTNCLFYGHTGGGSYSFYFQGSIVRFSGGLGVMAPLPPLGVWLHMEFERGWNVPADPNYKLRFDGVLHADFGGANNAIIVDRIGGNVPVPPTMFGDFDLKNLIIDNGNIDSPNLILDMPMDPNACDIGPSAFKGTTFNMDLPDCP